jgi:hemerythrin-like domain-containing protein
VGEGEKTRLIAWDRELRAVHHRLRAALEVTRAAVLDGTETTGPAEAAEPATQELLLYCHGFCAALNGHHRGEDSALFPSLAKQHPQLGETLRSLQQDHSMIAHLLNALQAAVQRSAPAAELERHLDGISAIVESHFRYEERQLLLALETLSSDLDPGVALGPL